jgi:hypothetical protein
MKLPLILLLASVLYTCDANPETSDDALTATEVNESLTDPGVQENEADLQQIDTDEMLIITALLAAPEASRDGAKVIGYNMAGEFVTLREGDNEFVCLADDPRDDKFSAACYHKDLEPFMARGRELKAEGMGGRDIFAKREEEVKSGQLKMGEMGNTLHVYSGPRPLYNPAANEVADAHYRYVVYVPFATAASTGLPESPIAPNHPWIMDPGTHTAHIMISPLKGE